MGVLGFKAAVASLVLAALLVGCEKKKDLSPPPVNASASDAVKIAVVFDDPEASNRYKVSMKAEYGNMALECSNVRHLQGGWVDYPHGYVDIENSKNNIFVIYRDHFLKREKCSWRFLGTGINIQDKLSGKSTGGGTAADRMTPGFKEEWACQPFNYDGSSSCLRKDLVRNVRGITLKVMSLDN